MSKNTRKTALKRPSTTTKPTKKVVTPLNQNIFASPWKKSDLILEVGDTEFHVHRTILTMHSPVFDAMFGGNFKEAGEERVKLPGKTEDEMLQFLKLLYPESMITTPLIDFAFGEQIVYSILRVADEYQTEELIRKCLAKTVINPENVFEILPYASKYNHEVREECIRHVAKRVAMSQVEKEIGKLDTPLMQELLVAKCQYLEKHLTKYRKCRKTDVSSSSSSEYSSSEESSD